MMHDLCEVSTAEQTAWAVVASWVMTNYWEREG